MGGTDLFVYHGYSRLYIEGRWLKATPAFNVELCARFGVPPVEFDGDRDALMHAFTADGAQHMEYVRERGVFDDLPLNAILTVLRHAYGPTIFTGAHPLDDVFTGRTRPGETPRGSKLAAGVSMNTSGENIRRRTPYRGRLPIGRSSLREQSRS